MPMPSLLLWIQEAATTTAQAPAGGPAGSGTPPATPGLFDSFGGVVPILLMAGVFWFFMIRPERTGRKKHKGPLSSLKKGHKVNTKGGLVGRVAAVEDACRTPQVDEGVRLK